MRPIDRIAAILLGALEDEEACSDDQDDDDRDSSKMQLVLEANGPRSKVRRVRSEGQQPRPRAARRA